jgi:DNA polymerase V
MQLARLFLLPVTAGFPSPAADFQERPLNLEDLLIVHPAATYFARVQGDSMRNLGIRENDIVVVDRALQARQNSIVLAQLHGGFIIKRLHVHNGITYLFSANSAYRPIKVTPEMDFLLWGVVTACIHVFV